MDAFIDELLRRLTLVLSRALDGAFAVVDSLDVELPALDWCDDRLGDLLRWRFNRSDAAKAKLERGVNDAIDKLLSELRVEFSAQGIHVAPRLRAVEAAS